MTTNRLLITRCDRQNGRNAVRRHAITGWLNTCWIDRKLPLKTTCC